MSHLIDSPLKNDTAKTPCSKVVPREPTENDGPTAHTELLKSSNRKRSYFGSPPPENSMPIASISASPTKRLYLHSMSPNVTRKTIYLNRNGTRSTGDYSALGSTAAKKSILDMGWDVARESGVRASSIARDSKDTVPDTPRDISKDSIKDNRDILRETHRDTSFSKEQRDIPTFNRGNSRNFTHDISHRSIQDPLPFSRRPTLAKPLLNPRSQSSLTLPRSRHFTHSPPKISLRRTNSLITPQTDLNSSLNSGSSSAPSDRFIPTRHNSTSAKLQTTTTNPHPNASPETHIKAQTSKIYQHHVAEACGLEVNSRVLLYQPLPPERKKPISLFDNKSSNSGSLLLNSKLRPGAASARAKKIPTAPERVLDAPGLVDDFYLNLLAWSSANLLAIGLEDAVYVWNASTGSVGLLCELPNKTLVTSLRWSDDGSYISIGKDDGLLEIWDIETNSKLRTLNCDNHQTRIASQSWHQHILTSGSRMGSIYNSDVRVASHIISKLENSHSAEICGIEYRGDGQQLVSGGNDNLVCIWDVRQCHNTTNANSVVQPLFTKSNHKAAVKALSWCPFQSNLLATGGGSTDKTINFWNTTTGARVNTIETGSQISSLNWGYAAGTGMELVATHGFPTNNISLFNYPTLQKTGEILGAHDSRILNGCLSPDSLTLATVAGDENLKFWSLFDLVKGRRGEGSGERLDDEYHDQGRSLKDDTKSMKKMMHIR